MQRNKRERGEGQLGCLFGLALLLLGILIAYKMIPVKVKAAEMRDVVVDEAKSAGTLSDKQIRSTILHKAEELELPITSEDLEIDRGQNDIRVTLDYSVPVNFPGYVYNWKFHVKAENPLF
ncbi:MAG TPA: hypothetical protein VFN10_07040 [Thermoanaerobaculia bacterium]|nr:hypothetical protein [Thermoanaerobaculia bacterium]